MDTVARASSLDREALFRRVEVATAREYHHASIVEKDFWVCWALRRIFEVLQFRPHLIFGEVPDWDNLVRELNGLETRINHLRFMA